MSFAYLYGASAIFCTLGLVIENPCAGCAGILVRTQDCSLAGIVAITQRLFTHVFLLVDHEITSYCLIHFKHQLQRMTLVLSPRDRPISPFTGRFRYRSTRDNCPALPVRQVSALSQTRPLTIPLPLHHTKMGPILAVSQSRILNRVRPVTASICH